MTSQGGSRRSMSLRSSTSLVKKKASENGVPDSSSRKSITSSRSMYVLPVHSDVRLNFDSSRDWLCSLIDISLFVHSRFQFNVSKFMVDIEIQGFAVGCFMKQKKYRYLWIIMNWRAWTVVWLWHLHLHCDTPPKKLLGNLEIVGGLYHSS